MGPDDDRCPRCGTGGTASSEDIRELGTLERRGALRRKAGADLLFLAGLVLGGPLLSFGSHARLGLFVCLGGALASILRRYTPWSVVGCVVIGALASAVVSAAVFDPDSSDPPAAEGAAGALSPVERREVFAARLGERLREEGVLLEARGPDLVTVWFYRPTADREECGEFPDARLRDHLDRLGFVRVVVATQNSAGGLCSFEP